MLLNVLLSAKTPCTSGSKPAILNTNGRFFARHNLKFCMVGCILSPACGGRRQNTAIFSYIFV
jgi:hypothetical protein